MSAVYLQAFVDCFVSWTLFHDDISGIEDATLLAVEHELSKVGHKLTPVVAEYVRNNTLSAVVFWDKYLGCDPHYVEHPMGYNSFKQFYQAVLDYRTTEPEPDDDRGWVDDGIW